MESGPRCTSQLGEMSCVIAAGSQAKQSTHFSSQLHILGTLRPWHYGISLTSAGEMDDKASCRCLNGDLSNRKQLHGDYRQIDIRFHRADKGDDPCIFMYCLSTVIVSYI